MPALDGMRVLDFTQYEAGPSCCQYLAWLGADVVKVEPPRGEPGRRTAAAGGRAQYFENYNANKRSVAVDVATDAGKSLLRRLVAGFDVFVENQGPHVMEKLGLDPLSLQADHPSLIYARIKGYGLSGPYAEYRSFDMLAQAAGGLFSLTGEADGPPVRPGGTFGDTATGAHSAMAILAAYVQQQRTGEGQVIEMSMHEVMTMFIRTTGVSGWDLDARGGEADRQPPRRRADGHVPVRPVRAERLRLRDGRHGADVGGAVQGARSHRSARRPALHHRHRDAPSTKRRCTRSSRRGARRAPSTRR